MCVIATVAKQRTEVNLSGADWRLWLDKTAPCQQNVLYLPTGGWAALSAENSMAVSVPSTVEEYLWDKVSAERKSPRRDFIDGSKKSAKNSATKPNS